jgi:Predicted dehydrogenases and related proteins
MAVCMPLTKIAVIGAGDISDLYLRNLTGLYREIEVAGIYSRTAARARAQAEKYNIPKVYGTLEELLKDPATAIVLNLTPPQEHFELSLKCLEAGKHVYTEKAMAATLEQGRILLETAKKKGLTICGAPDKFLTAGIQTMRKVIDDGIVGKLTGAYVTVMFGGHESWHPNPAFFYREGGGPMMDLGVYPLTSMIHLFGSVEAVAGLCGTAFPERTVTSKPLFGTTIKVETPTQVMGLMRFQSGLIATVMTSFDACPELPNNMIVYGTKGMLKMDAFGGPVSFFRPDKGEFCELPMLFQYNDEIHGMGLADQAAAIEKGRRPRASGELILHVLEIMTAFKRSNDTGAFVDIVSRVDRPAPMADPVLPYVVPD